MVSSLDNKEEYIDELRRIVLGKLLIKSDTVTIASDTGAINEVFNDDGIMIGYSRPLAITYGSSKSVMINPEHPADIKCTGHRCSVMIPQKTKRNKIKLCPRCQNRIWRRSIKNGR